MTTQYIENEGGRVAYDLAGDGPLVVCVPGMSELRSSYDDTRSTLAVAGYRVAAMDLRGHGESDASFDRYDDEAIADDIRALVGTLGGPAVVIGSSMGAAAPTIMLRALLLKPWGPKAWTAYHRSLFTSAKPAGLREHQAMIAQSLRRPAYWRAFQTTTPGRRPLPCRRDDGNGRSRLEGCIASGTLRRNAACA